MLFLNIPYIKVINLTEAEVLLFAVSASNEMRLKNVIVLINPAPFANGAEVFKNLFWNRAIIKRFLKYRCDENDMVF